MWGRAGPFGLAHGASFNEIDRAVIEMRTKLARDNTRPLISAARGQRTRLRRAGKGWFVRSFPRTYVQSFVPNLSVSREFGKCLGQTSVIWQIARDRVGEARSFISARRMDVSRVNIQIDKFAADGDAGWGRVEVGLIVHGGVATGLSNLTAVDVFG